MTRSPRPLRPLAVLCALCASACQSLAADHDANGDGCVDLLDFASLQRCWGATSGSCVTIHDSSGNGSVGSADLTAATVGFEARFGAPQEGKANPPLLDAGPEDAGAHEADIDGAWSVNRKIQSDFSCQSLRSRHYSQ